MYGLGADKHVHKVVPPAENTSWAGPKVSRQYRSAAKVARQGAADGCIALCRTGKLLAAGYADGSITLRTATGLAAVGDDETTATVGIHDITAGGTCCDVLPSPCTA